MLHAQRQRGVVGEMMGVQRCAGRNLRLQGVRRPDSTPEAVRMSIERSAINKFRSIGNLCAQGKAPGAYGSEHDRIGLVRKHPPPLGIATLQYSAALKVRDKAEEPLKQRHSEYTSIFMTRIHVRMLRGPLHGMKNNMA